jgi:Holliday junction resolvase RusA-like endonuclease
MIIKIPLLCRSKKNSQQIIYNRVTKKPMVIQSKIYNQFEKDCAIFLKQYGKETIDYPVNLKCTFYVKDRKKRDLTNLENAIADILVKYKVIEDDNYNIIQSWDGCRIIYRPKQESETIIEITKI